jgi:tetratricopeptide (TPR) repeat protein
MQKAAYGEAVELYGKLTQIAPHDYTLLSTFGFAKMLSGDPHAALPPLEKSAKMRPNDPTVLANLALGRFHAGDWSGAAQIAQRVLSQDAADAEMLFVAAQADIQGGDADSGALDAFRSYCARNPQDLTARLRLGLCCAAVGAFDEAVAEYRAILERAPGHPLALLRLVTLGAIDPDDADASRLAALAEAGDLDAEDAINLHFVLGKLLERKGQAEQAFLHYERANAMRAQNRPWNRQRFRDRIAAIRQAFGPDSCAVPGDAGVADETPIFIVGMPRSGSSLVEQILAAHPHVHGGGELPDLLGRPETYGLTSGAGEFPGFLEGLGPESARAGAEKYIARLRELSADAERVTDKLPGNFQYLGLIAAILPKAKIIHSLRDPLDTCFSCYTTDFGTGQGFTFDLEALGEYFRLYQELMAFWHETLPIPILDVGYEALVENPREETARMLDFCGLPWDDACLEPHKADRPVFTASMWQVRQPIYASAKGRAVPFRQWLEPALGWARAPE